MQKKNLPRVDTRYWTALFVASVLGTIFGDYLADDLGLGFTAGLAPIAVLFMFIIFSEKRVKWHSEIFYWLAIVLTRTAATNLADFMTHQLKIGFGIVAVILGGLLAAVVFVRQRGAPALAKDGLPIVNASYWVTILIASTLGTDLGDFVSEGLKLGFGGGTIILGFLLAAVLFLKSKAKVQTESYHWFAIAILRTTGTTTGDFISSSDGLNLGLRWGALVAAVVLFAVLKYLPKRVPSANRIKI